MPIIPCTCHTRSLFSWWRDYVAVPPRRFSPIKPAPFQDPSILFFIQSTTMLLVLALTAVLATSVFGEKRRICGLISCISLSLWSSGDSCESHNHPQYGKVGRCISTSNCASGLYISGLCESHGGDVKCCFSPSSSGSSKSILARSTMESSTLLLFVAVDSKLDYSGAVYIQSPHHSNGRSGNAISCAFDALHHPMTSVTK